MSASQDHAPNTSAATEKEPLPPAADVTAWLVEETWSGYVHYVHRGFNCADWEAERRRNIDRRRNGLRQKQMPPLVTKLLDEAMTFDAKDRAAVWLAMQPHWMSHGDQYQVREHMWPAVAREHSSPRQVAPPIRDGQS